MTKRTCKEIDKDILELQNKKEKIEGELAQKIKEKRDTFEFISEWIPEKYHDLIKSDSLKNFRLLYDPAGYERTVGAGCSIIQREDWECSFTLKEIKFVFSASQWTGQGWEGDVNEDETESDDNEDENTNNHDADVNDEKPGTMAYKIASFAFRKAINNDFKDHY